MAKDMVLKLKNKLGNILDILPIAIFAYQNLKIVYANNIAKKIFEIDSNEDFLGRDILDFIPKDKHKEVIERIRDGLRKKSTNPEAVLYEIITGKRNTIWVEIKAHLIYIDEIPTFLDFVIDRTQEIQGKIRLKESEQRLRKLLDNAYDAIFFEDIDGSITDVNKAACKMLGYTKEELIGMNIDKFIPEKLIRVKEDYLKDPTSPERRYIIEAENIRKDGTRIPLELSISKVPLEDR